MHFITCFEKIDTSKGRLSIGASRTFGYYDTFEKCEDALNENRLDMWEYLYDYAVVEEIDPGIHSLGLNRVFFAFDKDKRGFFRIDEPEELRRRINFALG